MQYSSTCEFVKHNGTFLFASDYIFSTNGDLNKVKGVHQCQILMALRNINLLLGKKQHEGIATEIKNDSGANMKSERNDSRQKTTGMGRWAKWPRGEWENEQNRPD